jgi:hypothetical protein
MIKPNVNDLIPYMPAAVFREFVLGGGEIMGIKAPAVEHWLSTSTQPFVEAWCDYVRRYVSWQYRLAERRQKIMNDSATEYYGKQNGHVRNKGVIDPVIMAHNRKCFDSPEAIRDTKQKEPKLFIK